MKEDFLHYIWKYGLFQDKNIKTQQGDNLEILNLGVHNFDSGPDFFNAKVKINETVWAGNIEIHLKSSDWYNHNHNIDKAYDNVVLQVVSNHDKDIFRTDGQVIPTLELDFNSGLFKNYNNLIESSNKIACSDSLKYVDSFKLQTWLGKLTVERLEQKAEYIKELLNQTSNSWETAFYFQLARNFGFRLNGDPFEMLAKSLPLSYLAKHKDNIFQLEALLFGQGGFLTDDKGDEYFNKLKNEYQYLKNKFQLKPIERHLWKFLRSRPGNFPTIRIAQFAQLIYGSVSLFSKVIEIKDIEDYYELFIIKPDDYWNNHYVFNKESVIKTKSLGKSAIDIILINTIVPFLFVYGKQKGIGHLQQRALDLLENIKAEKNATVNTWTEMGVKPINAFDTQALIQLTNGYCSQKNCLNCQIGNVIINN